MAERGFNTAGMALVNALADGVSLSSVWDELLEASTLWNSHTTALANLLSYRTTDSAAAVPQKFNSERFSVATEFGVPEGIGSTDYIKCAATLRDYDLATRFTWKALRNMTSEQVTHATQRIFDADATLINGMVLQRILDPTQYENEHGVPCYGLWTGTDSMRPPPFMGQTFPADTSHYLGTASLTLDAADLEQAIKLIRDKGFGLQGSHRFVLLIHPADFDAAGISTWRSGAEYAAGKKPKFDFVVGQNAPAYLSNEEIKGPQPPAEVGGLPVTGTYGGCAIIESHYIPKGYAVVAATGGPGSESNPVALREHVNESYRGLRLVPGHFQGYPLIESYFVRTAGVGVRYRGAAVAIEISENIHYGPPVIDFAR